MNRAIAKQLTPPVDAPRDYQREDIGKLKVACDLVMRLLYVAFMGTGKTVVAASLVRHWVAQGDRVLYLVHRWEILKQTERKLLAAGLPRSMMSFHRRKGSKDYAVNLDAPIHIASIDTLRHRDVIPGITRIVVDEAHHVASAGWSKLLACYPKMPVLGLTATPVRLDGKPLAEHFDRMVTQTESVEELIKAGWLARPDIFSWDKDALPSLKGLKKVRGDYSAADAERSMRLIVGRMPDHWKKHAQGVPTVGFAASERQIDDLIAQFTAAGIKTEMLLGYHTDAERDRKLAALASGTISVLWTCDVLGEGWDFPAARCAIIAAPTASLRRYLQWCGRVMRPGTPSIILDHAGMSWIHGAPWADQGWSLEARLQPTKQVAAVDADGHVSFREPVEVDGDLVRVTDLPRRQKVCAGPSPATGCASNRSVPRSGALSRGQPWRCASCAALHRWYARTTPEEHERVAVARQQTVCAG